MMPTLPGRPAFGYTSGVTASRGSSSNDQPLIGAHVGSSGGLSRAVGRALDIGANCFQIFVSAPQQWRLPSHPDGEVEAFCSQFEQSGIHAFYIHAIYLLNPAGPDAELRRKSVESVREYLRWANRLCASGVIVHLGSSAGTTPEEAHSNLCASLSEALQDAGDVPLLLETSAGTRNSMGSTFSALGSILRTLRAGRQVAVCLDTAHVWAAGYDVATPEGLDRTLEEFDREIGLDQLVLIHANDSKVELGGARDRHEDIPKGQIGVEGWRTLLAHPRLRRLPWVMETPGLGKPESAAAQVRAMCALWRGEEVEQPE